MSSHADAKAMRNLCFKLAKGGASPNGYREQRKKLIELKNSHETLVPDFIVECETADAVRSHLYTLFPRTEETGAYKRRRRYLEGKFAGLVFSLERDELSHELTLLRSLTCEDREAMDHVVHLVRDCAEVDPSRSILLSRHSVLDLASYLLSSHGVFLDDTAEVKGLIEQICDMATRPSAGQRIHFVPDRLFVTAMMPLAEYIDKQDKFYGWELGNRTPKVPSVQVARQICQAATLLCETLWQWTIDDNFLTLRPHGEVEDEDEVPHEDQFD